MLLPKNLSLLSFLSLRHVALAGRPVAMLTPARCPAVAPCRASWVTFRRVRRNAGQARAARRSPVAVAVPVSIHKMDEDASAPTVIRAPPGSRIYFAYGSNVNTKTFTGTRGIVPAASYPVVLRGYRLVFNVPGLPFVEPAFASVMKVSRDVDAQKKENTTNEDEFDVYENETHGVAYVVTETQWKAILRSETSYVCEDVVGEVYTSYQSEKTMIEATTLTFPDVDVGSVTLLPSRRYLDLLKEGASEWTLDAGWVNYLTRKVQAYDSNLTPGKAAGAAVAAMSFAPLVLSAAPFVAAAAAAKAFEKTANSFDTNSTENISEEIVEAAVAEGFRTLGTVTWRVHNVLWAPLFGSGGNNDE